MDNLIKTFLYIDLIIFTFIVFFIIFNKYFTRTDVTLLVDAPTPNFDVDTSSVIKSSDIYGNLCGNRKKIDADYYLSDNYLSILDPIDNDLIFHNGGKLPMSPGFGALPLPKDSDINKGNRFEIVKEFNDGDGTSCRRCYGVNANVYKAVSPSNYNIESYQDMNKCRGGSEESCRLTCEGRGRECLGYVMLEKRITLPPPKKTVNIPGGGKLTRNFISNYQSCDGKGINLLQPIHDIYCGLITPETLQKTNKKCVDRTTPFPTILNHCQNLGTTSECTFGGKCEKVKQNTFDNYRTIGYTCGHGSGIGGETGYRNDGAVFDKQAEQVYIVQQNNNLNPSVTSESLSFNPMVNVLFNEMPFSARGLLKNFSHDNTGWQVPTMPIPIQDQWYIPCQASTHLNDSIADPIDIGTGNYDITNSSTSLINPQPIPLSVPITTDKNSSYIPKYPQAIAQKQCEKLCLSQDFTRVPGLKTQPVSSPSNQNYKCGGYTVTQKSHYPRKGSTISPTTSVKFDCNLYNTDVTAEIPYQYAALSGPSAKGCPAASPSPAPAPNCPVPNTPDIVVNLCGMKVDTSVFDKIGGVEHQYNRNIAQLIRAGQPEDNDYYNQYIYNHFNKSNTFAACAGPKGPICDMNIPFGKIRTNSPPPEFIASPSNDAKVGAHGTNLWFPFKVA